MLHHLTSALILALSLAAPSSGPASAEPDAPVAVDPSAVSMTSDGWVIDAAELGSSRCPSKIWFKGKRTAAPYKYTGNGTYLNRTSGYNSTSTHAVCTYKGNFFFRHQKGPWNNPGYCAKPNAYTVKVSDGRKHTVHGGYPKYTTMQSSTNQGTGKNFCVMRAEVKITVKE